MLRRLARRKAEREKAIQRAKDAVAEIDAAGVQVKDLDIGLLDFPCMVDGDVVLLCWKLGEKGITHYHGTSEGFAGRKPIDGRISARAEEESIRCDEDDRHLVKRVNLNRWSTELWRDLKTRSGKETWVATL